LPKSTPSHNKFICERTQKSSQRISLIELIKESSSLSK
jgi:hypothetical protein